MNFALIYSTKAFGKMSNPAVEFQVGDILDFNAKDGKVYKVNFRGYHNGGAIIVGKAADRIGQMGVSLDQLSHSITDPSKGE